MYPMDGAAQRRKLPLLSLLRALWKQKLLAGAVWLVGTAGAVTVVQLLPAIYRAEAVILVESQRARDEFAGGQRGQDEASV